MECCLLEKDLGVLVDSHHEPARAQVAKNVEVSLYQKECGQQDQGSYHPPLISIDGATPQALHSVLGFSVQERH